MYDVNAGHLILEAAENRKESDSLDGKYLVVIPHLS